MPIAKDYMVKPLREAEALAAIERALKEVRLSNETRQLAAELAESHRQLEQRGEQAKTTTTEPVSNSVSHVCLQSLSEPLG